MAATGPQYKDKEAFVAKSLHASVSSRVLNARLNLSTEFWVFALNYKISPIKPNKIIMNFTGYLQTNLPHKN